MLEGLKTLGDEEMKKFPKLQSSNAASNIKAITAELMAAGIEIVRPSKQVAHGILHEWTFERRGAVWNATAPVGDEYGIPNETAAWLDEEWKKELCFGNHGETGINVPSTVNFCIIRSQRAFNTLAALIDKLAEEKAQTELLAAYP